MLDWIVTHAFLFQVPIWQLASPSYKHYTRQEHKALALQQQQQQDQQHKEHESKPSAGTVAGIVTAAVTAAVVVVAGITVAVLHKRKQMAGKVRPVST